MDSKYVDDSYSPYCSKCGSCGESGCCDPLMCVMLYKELRSGDYCESSFNEVICEVESFREIYEYIMKLEDSSIDSIKKAVDKIYGDNLDKFVYG